MEHSTHNTPNWLDLPQGITELFLYKLHFPDQIRALAVCKTWLDCKVHVRRSDTLPWVLHHHELPIESYSETDSDTGSDNDNKREGGCGSESEGDFHTDQKESVGEIHTEKTKSEIDAFICEFFDPYSRKTHKVEKAILATELLTSLEEKDRNYPFRKSWDLKGIYEPLASKNGWNWVLFNRGEVAVFFLHNPFTNDICCAHDFSYSDDDQMQAAIKGDPTSPECVIFTVHICDNKLGVDITEHDGYSGSYLIDDEKVAENVVLHSALYMNGSIYCLFHNGELKKYGLEDESWELLTSGFPEPYELSDSTIELECWLLEINGNIIMTRMVNDGGETCKWMIFKFDWSLMSWIVETNLKSCAIYISGNVALSSPLKNRHGEILEGCMLYYLAYGVFKCYSMSEATWVEIPCEEYNWISSFELERYDLSFIEPPYIT